MYSLHVKFGFCLLPKIAVLCIKLEYSLANVKQETLKDSLSKDSCTMMSFYYNY